MACRAQPLCDHDHAHEDVAEDEDEEVLVGKDRSDARGQDEHPAHLHDRHHPVEPVVGVERGREPREVHPRPPDREEDHEVLAKTVAEVAGSDRVMEIGRGDGHRDDEHEVEEELE